MIVDAHTHLLPGRLAERVRVHFGAAVSRLVYPLDHQTVRAELESEGIDEIWSLPYAHKPGVAQGLNESSRDIATAAGPLSIVGGATVHPGDAEPGVIVETAFADLGLRVLKLHCSVGTFAADDPRLDGVWDLVSQLRMPVVVHAGHAPSGQTTADELAPIEAVAARHPGAVIIIAHCGYPAVDAAVSLVERHAGVYADLTPVVHARPTLGTLLDALPHKFLFGSDAPNVALHAGDHLRELRAAGMKPDTLDAVVGGTARRLVAAVGR